MPARLRAPGGPAELPAPARLAAALTVLLVLPGCDAGAAAPVTAPTSPASPAPEVTAASSTALPVPAPPPPGNPDGSAAVPPEAQPVDTSDPDTVVGDGTPASCTSEAVVAAVAAGGIITFDCGPEPVTITLTETAKIFNATGPEIVLDGGGLVTLSGGGERRILYMNTCDQAQGWTTSHCQDQDRSRLTVQSLTFADGDAAGETAEGGGGGAIFVRGGRFKVINSRFVRNRCDPTGPDLGGAAIRVLSQHQGRPVYVVPREPGTGAGPGTTAEHREVVIGATSEEGPDDRRPSAGGVFALLRDARALVPALDEAAFVESTLRARPATPDNLPILGPSGTPGLHLATGHHRGGVLLAPLTAEAVVAGLTGASVPAVLDVARPDRFIPAFEGA